MSSPLFNGLAFTGPPTDLLARIRGKHWVQKTCGNWQPHLHRGRCVDLSIPKMRIVPGSSAWLTTALVLVTTVGASLVAAVLAVARQPSWGTVILALAVVLVTQAFIENVISVHAAGVAISWSSVGLFVLGLLLLVGLTLALAVTLSRASWRETTQECITTLRSAAATRVKPRVYNPRMLDGLPDPVIRYFKRTLVPSCPMVKCATLNQHGEFRTVAIEGNRDNPWQPFEGVEFFTASPPGFVWDAQIRCAS